MGAEKHPDDKLQSQGRKDNAAQPLNAAPDNAGAERYPSVNKDDSVAPQRTGGERRSYESAESKNALENPRPRQGAGDGGPYGA